MHGRVLPMFGTELRIPLSGHGLCTSYELDRKFCCDLVRSCIAPCLGMGMGVRAVGLYFLCNVMAPIVSLRLSCGK